jgi:hypothetical protein
LVRERLPTLSPSPRGGRVAMLCPRERRPILALMGVLLLSREMRPTLALMGALLLVRDRQKGALLLVREMRPTLALRATTLA